MRKLPLMLTPILALPFWVSGASAALLEDLERTDLPIGQANGVTVEIENNTLAVGSPDGEWDETMSPALAALVEIPSDTNGGFVVMYDRNDRGEWMPNQVLTSPNDMAGECYWETDLVTPTIEELDPDPYTGFGYEIEIVGDDMVVSSPWENCETGAVYLYHRVNGMWELVEDIRPPEWSDDPMWGGFGESIAFDGQTLVVGSPWTWFSDNWLVGSVTSEPDLAGLSDYPSGYGVAHIYAEVGDGHYVWQSLYGGDDNYGIFPSDMDIDDDLLIISSSRQVDVLQQSTFDGWFVNTQTFGDDFGWYGSVEVEGDVIMFSHDFGNLSSSELAAVTDDELYPESSVVWVAQPGDMSAGMQLEGTPPAAMIEEDFVWYEVVSGLIPSSDGMGATNYAGDITDIDSDGKTIAVTSSVFEEGEDDIEFTSYVDLWNLDGSPIVDADPIIDLVFEHATPGHTETLNDEFQTSAGVSDVNFASGHGAAFWKMQVTVMPENVAAASAPNFDAGAHVWSPPVEAVEIIGGPLTAEIHRLYSAYFLRDPDAAGMQYWREQRAQGQTLAQVSDWFATSPEFQNTYGNLTDEQFVNLVYNNVLGRTPDAAGYDFWLSQIQSSSVTRSGMMMWFAQSTEYIVQTHTEAPNEDGSVTRLYSAFFLRTPDAAGLEFWIDSKAGGVSLEAIASEFAKSPEFQARYGSLTNEQFVNLVYNNVLERTPDAEGKAFWLSKLDAGTSRGEMMIGFSNSPEYILKTDTTP